MHSSTYCSSIAARSPATHAALWLRHVKRAFALKRTSCGVVGGVGGVGGVTPTD
jgi:hypothetical protein